MFFRYGLAAGLMALATNAAQADVFLCPGLGDVDVRITFLEGTNAAVAEFMPGADTPSGPVDPVTLRSQPAGDGLHYVGGDLVLRGSADLAELTSGELTVDCEPEGGAGGGEASVDVSGGAGSVGESAGAGESGGEGGGETAGDTPGAADIPALSLGGNLRAGPGVEFADVGGLVQGTAITLLVNTGVVLDGYTWWEIEQANGEISFQWGGVICVPGGGVTGVLDRCE
ncbi:MAG: hypothetical protein JKY00_06320 [Roseicyclus sp.]|nr:hypothetical protein [Roseicyclus sp.]